MAAFAPFEAAVHIAVALSGGVDSTVLLHLAERWARAAGGRCTALIVDHNVRAGSDREAQLVAGRAEAAGIPTRILKRQGARPGSGLQAELRQDRYALLAVACRELGILHLLLGHHADDQNETVAMRRRRSAVGDGPAGMPACREIRGLRLLRPLLGFARARIVATAQAARVDWVEDPSNRLSDFERVRLRQAAAVELHEGSAARPAAAADRLAREAAAAALAAQVAVPHPLGFVSIAPHAFQNAPLAIRVALLRHILVTVSGATHAPAMAASERLAGGLQARIAGRWTLHGCLVSATGNRIVIAREPRAVRGHVAEEDGLVRWDGRFVLPRSLLGRVIEPLGAGSPRLPGIPRVATFTLPACCKPDTLWVGGTAALVWRPRVPLFGGGFAT